ncbi:hypothetical protein BD560DRAFT_422990 [Blakeslea trispora]|nr:hypothetical protein BD560DRAFT_422990 [Blakeslea trispora]
MHYKPVKSEQILSIFLSKIVQLAVGFKSKDVLWLHNRCRTNYTENGTNRDHLFSSSQYQLYNLKQNKRSESSLLEAGWSYKVFELQGIVELKVAFILVAFVSMATCFCLVASQRFAKYIVR